MNGIIWARKLKKQLNGKVLDSCVVPAYVCICGLVQLALTVTVTQEEKPQVAENNWVKRIM